MKYAPLFAALLSFHAAGAVASDLPSRKAPPDLGPLPPPPPPLRTSFYIGVNAGGAISDRASTLVTTGLIASNPDVVPSSLISGAGSASGASGLIGDSGDGSFVGGGQIGVAVELRGGLYIGLETDIQGFASGGNRNTLGTAAAAPAFPGNFALATLSAAHSLDYLGTVRERVGYMVLPTVLVYATGGFAYGGASGDTAIAQALVGPATKTVDTPYFSNGAYSNTRIGWTVGGGFEWRFMPNLSAKLEYLYYDLGVATYYDGVLGDPMTGKDAGNFLHILGPLSSTRFAGHIIRAGVNYHFNWDPLVPALARI